MVSDTRSYHHGDLRSALVEAGLTLARVGGANALGLRRVTRTVGVTPNAAYRHFADRRALILAVAVEAQDRLARAMLDRMDAIDSDIDPAERALLTLRAVGLGYIHFALSEPGWFEVALLSQDAPSDDGSADYDQAVPPFRLLLDALDQLVDAGVLAQQRRVGAEWACWSAVHGFADLATRGPLRTQDRSVIDHVAVQVVDTIINGLRT